MTARTKTPTNDPPTVPDRPAVRDSLEDARTAIFDSGSFRRAPSPPAEPAPAAPARRQIQAISMKTPASEKIAVDEMQVKPEPQIRRPMLRPMSEVSLVDHPLDLGNFAPPADPSEIRARKRRELVLIVSLSIIVASIVALGIWFLAR